MVPRGAATSARRAVIVHEQEAPAAAAVALYARVSSHQQKDQLTAQLGRLLEYVAEIGSGLNGHRPKLMKLLKNKDVSAIVVEHRDRV
jgi:putative resolvase